MKLIVGLGNYGDKYAYTHHNMGFLAVECLADKLGLKFKKKECDALIAEGFFNGEKLVLAKPLTYMNLSGVAVKQLLKKHKADTKDMVVIYDDIDIERGTLRVRQKGSAGTHNGMRNIIETIGTEEFPRVRVGIGKPPPFVPLADFVLGDVPQADRKHFYDLLAQAADEALKLTGIKV